LVLALLGSFAQDLGFIDAPCMHHFLKFSQLAPNIRTPRLFYACTPTPKTPRGDAIAKDQIPARLVTVAWRSLGAGAKAVNLAVKVDFLWWLQPRSSHGVNKLRLGGSDQLLRGR
jgi:hypothetical protein